GVQTCALPIYRVDCHQIGQQRAFAETRLAYNAAQREADRHGDQETEYNFLCSDPKCGQHVAAGQEVLADKDDVGAHFRRRRKDYGGDDAKTMKPLPEKQEHSQDAYHGDRTGYPVKQRNLLGPDGFGKALVVVNSDGLAELSMLCDRHALSAPSLSLVRI